MFCAVFPPRSAARARHRPHDFDRDPGRCGRLPPVVSVIVDGNLRGADGGRRRRENGTLAARLNDPEGAEASRRGRGAAEWRGVGAPKRCRTTS